MCLVRALVSVADDAVLGTAGFIPSAEHPIGFRGDGTGRFPAARPLTEWDLSRKDGVVWSTDLPGSGCGSPVVAGSVVVVTAEPDLVVALDAASGKELWRHKADALETLPEAEKRDLMAKVSKALARVAAARKALADFKPNQEVEIDSPQAPVNKGMLEEELKSALKDAQTLNSKVLVVPDDYYGAFGGLACATPATDGKSVVAQFGSGSLVCCDMTGKRLWMVMARAFGWAMVGESPLIHAGRVYVVKGQRNNPTIAAYSMKDGALAWEKIVSNPDHGGSGSLVLLRTPVGNRVVWPGGEMLDPGSGDIVKFGASSDMGSSIAPDDGRFFVQQGDYHAKPAKIIGLKIGADGQVEKFLSLDRPNKRHAGFASLLLHDGLLYARMSGNTANDLEIVDVTAGTATLHSQNFGSDRTWFAPSPTLAGERIFVITGDGVCTILKPGAKPERVGVRNLEPMGSSPYFQGERMYVRTYGKLICIGK